jgi:hypothetical protein
VVFDGDPNSKKLVARKDGVKELPGSYLLLASVGDTEKFQLYLANQQADGNPKPLLPDVKNAFSQDGSNGVYTLKANHVAALQNWVPVGAQKLKIVIPQNVFPPNFPQHNTREYGFSNYRLDFSRDTAAMLKDLADREAQKKGKTQEIEQMQRLIGQARQLSQDTLPVFGSKLLGNTIKPEDPLFKFDPASREAQKNIYGAFHEYLGHLLERVKKEIGDDDSSSIFASNDSDGLDRYAASVDKDLKRMREKCEKLSKDAADKKKDAAQKKLAFITQVQGGWKSLTDQLPLSKLSSVVDPNRFAQQKNAEIQGLTKAVQDLDASMPSLRNHPFVKGKLPQGTYTVRVEEPGSYSIPLVNFIQTEGPE